MNCDNCRWFNKTGFVPGFGDCTLNREVHSTNHEACEHYEEYSEMTRLIDANALKIEQTEIFIENDIVIDDVKVGNVELCPERKEISRLVIYEPYQNKGYGTEVIKTLVNQGYKSLWVRSDNERAIHVYEKCGFVKGETHMFEMKHYEYSDELTRANNGGE